MRQCVIILLMLIGITPSFATLSKKKSVTMEAMWRLIQDQQKEIEALKEKVNGSTDNHLSGTLEVPSKSATTAMTSSDHLSSDGPASKEANPSKVPDKSTKAQGAGKSDAERKTDILANEVEKLKTRLLIPDKREYKVEYGLGPAASEVYRVNRGLSIGGYGEWFYTNYSQGVKSTFDDARAVIYVGYKFNDWILMNSEFEFEHGSTGEGSEQKGEVSNEFAYLDFLLNPKSNVRTGLLLVPMGFINEIHEGPTFHGNRRPTVEQVIIPTTWREMGAGIWGQLAEGLQYRMYGLNGLNAAGFTSAGISEGRQGGTYALAQDFAFTGRLDYYMPFVPGLQVGASSWVGNSGQDNEYAGSKVNALTQLYEGHIQWRYKGFEMRALGAVGSIGNAAQLSLAKKETIGSQNYGWYTEFAYDVMPFLLTDSTQYLAPFFRYEAYNTLAKVPTGFTNYGGLYDQWIFQGGLTYKPITNVAVKLDYQNFNSAAHPLPDQFNLGVAFFY